MTEILDIIGLPALLDQLAEECAELGQASLKYARRLRNENPTPKTEQECIDALVEETADVELCLNILIVAGIISNEDILKVFERKDNRWLNRLKEAHHEEQ